jgi:uncharacterized protein
MEVAMTQALREWLSDVGPSKPPIFKGPITTSYGTTLVEFDSSSLRLKVDGEPVTFRTDPAEPAPSSPSAPQFEIPQDEPVSKFFVHVNNFCNLRCTYCYEEDLPYDQIKDKVLPDARIQEVCRFIERSAQGASKVQITLFGGEPLLSFKQVLALHRTLERLLGEGAFKTSLVTNGTMMNDQHLAFINDKNVEVMVSFDGTRENQDRQRPGPNNSSNYDRVVENIVKLVESGAKKVSVRITYGQESLDLLTSIKEVARLGAHDMAFRPIMDGTPVNQWEDYELHAGSLRNVVDYYFEQLVKEQPVIVNNVHEVVRRILFEIPKTGYCDWGKICSITPDGDIYPCTHFVGIPEFKMGSAKAGGRLNRALQAELLSATKLGNLPCNECSVKHLCGGGCRGCSHYVHSDIFREDDYCEARREIVYSVLTNLVEMRQDGRWETSSGFMRSLLAQGDKKHSCDRFS